MRKSGDSFTKYQIPSTQNSHKGDTKALRFSMGNSALMAETLADFAGCSGYQGYRILNPLKNIYSWKFFTT
jgi:hypothetical protein